MLIDRSHKPWLLFSALIVVMATVAYAVESQTAHGVTGGSVLGLILGVVGSFFMVIAGLLAVRKRLPTWRVGSAQFWLRAHLWLGTVGFFLVLLHSGFGWGGLLENLLWISFGLVVVTGFAGLALQQFIPKLLTSQVPLETFIAQIPFLSLTTLFRADQLVTSHAGPLDVPFEKLVPFATAVLKQQAVLKRESDLPKELAKVYANVPQPEGDAKKGHTAEKPAAPAKPITTVPISAEPSTNQDAPATKPKSPLELMQEKATAAKMAVAAVAASSNDMPAAKPKSPLELMQAKMSAAKGSPAGKPVDSPKPLTVEEQPVAAQEILQASGVAMPPIVKKPLPVSKPASAEAAETKPKPVVISPVQLAALRDFHLKIVRPFLEKGRSPQHGMNEASNARRLFAQLKSDLPAELHEILQQLEAFCEERRQFTLQKRLHRWLHWWLILHIPPSIALLVLFVAHVVMSLRVVPFGR